MPPFILTGLCPIPKFFPDLRDGAGRIAEEFASSDGVQSAGKILRLNHIVGLDLGIDANPKLVSVFFSFLCWAWIVEPKYRMRFRIREQTFRLRPSTQFLPSILLWRSTSRS